MKSFEDFVDCSVVTPPIPPTFNNSPVIPMYHEVPLSLLTVSKGPDQTFESNGFSPADISLSVKSLPP